MKRKKNRQRRPLFFAREARGWRFALFFQETSEVGDSAPCSLSSTAILPSPH